MKLKYIKLVRRTVTTKNKNSQIVHSLDEVLELLLGKSVHGEIIIDDEDELALYNEYKEKVSSNIRFVAQDVSDDFHETHTNDWNIPAKYLDIDIDQYLLDKCASDIEVARVTSELAEFKKRGLSVVLNLMIFLVDHFTENDIVWGVGRGSSAASYCLYLIGINRVNSLTYNLDIKEFFK